MTTGDVTERGRVEEETLRWSRNRYRTLVETITHGIEEIDASGVITFANAAHHRQYEYSEGELIGMSIFDIVPTESEADELREYLEYLVKEQPSPSPYRGQKRTKSGKIIDVEVAWTYTRDAEERVTGFISIISDITELKRAVDALRKAHGELEMRVEERTSTLVSANQQLQEEIAERKRAEEALQKVREELEGRVERQILLRNRYRLTFRELMVLHLVGAGRSNKEIGLELGISPLTASKHVSNILAKMSVASRTEASVTAVKEGLLD